jgi:hypothetical protein
MANRLILVDDEGNPYVINGSGTAGVTDHNALFGRSAQSAHPISAVTGLEETLSERVSRVAVVNGSLVFYSNPTRTYIIDSLPLSALTTGSRGTVNLSSQCNGSTIMFSGNFHNSAVAMVFLNGVKLVQGTEYNIGSSALYLLIAAPPAGSTLEVELF